MNKEQFIYALRERLSALPKQEVDERIDFFCEMIDDRIEDGLTEEEAIKAIGSVDEIALQIADEIPLPKIISNKIKGTRKRKTWEIVLLAVGSPIWGSLLISALAVIFSLYVSLWAIVVSLWASELAFVLSPGFGIVSSIAIMISGDVSTGLITLGSSFAIAGIAIFFFFVCKLATKGMIYISRKIPSIIKRCFVRKDK
jgi:uncharacterized membrane protein